MATLSCDSTDDADVDPAYWIGLTSSNSNVTLVGPCPTGYCYRKYFHNSVLFSKDTVNTTYLSKKMCNCQEILPRLN